MPLRLPEWLAIDLSAGENPAVVCLVDPRQNCGQSIGVDLIRTAIEELGAGGWHVDEAQIAKLIRERHKLQTRAIYRVAEPRDARVRVCVSPDRLSASVEVAPAFGGKPVTEEWLREELAKSSVVFGFDEQQLKEIVAAGQCGTTVVARGVAAQHGKDAEFVPLVEESSHKGKPQERSDGSVNHHDLGLVQSVTEGAPLLRRIAPTQGTPGTSVTGEEIPPRPGKDRNCTPGSGTRVSDEDPNLVIAAASGQPVYTATGVRIVEKLELQGVGIETGDIEFDGSVHIRGPIQPGFTVRAGGNIVATDTVEGAGLSAGGSIDLNGGVYGKSHFRLSARGNIRARFLSNCEVDCGGDLIMEDLLTGCMVVCEGSIILGEGGGKGQAYGGQLLATKGIRARILGSAGETPTRVEVRAAPHLITQNQEVLREISRLERNLDNVDRSLQFLLHKAGKSDERVAALREDSDRLNEQLRRLRSESLELQEKIDNPSGGAIQADIVHPGVTLRVGRRTLSVSARMQRLTVVDGPEEEADGPTARSDHGNAM